MKTEGETDKERNGARQVTNMYIRNFQQAIHKEHMWKPMWLVSNLNPAK